jgi:peptidyl-prolyl cis-trans isomerase A (cyclophilin A)
MIRSIIFISIGKDKTMLKKILFILACGLPILFAGVGYTAGPAKNPVVLMETSLGNMKLELFAKEAPISVKNFLDYVNSGLYNGTIFHRVIPNFMIQGGGFTADLRQKKANPPIKNEADNGLKNLAGTLAMARTMVVDSATSQFFINVVDNDFLNHRDNTPQGYGYAVFGKVSEGMDVVNKIVAIRTGTQKGFQDVPETTLVIKSMKVLP